jgi:hypothetical protein
LARIFRYYGKKRGNRRSGSPVWASVGEALFFAVFVLLGCAGMVLIFSDLVVPEWRVHHEFVETPCKVLDKRVGDKPGEGGLVYRPEIRIEYEVAGTTYRDWHHDIHGSYSSRREDAQSAIDKFALYDPAKNNRCPCWYDPLNPKIVVLVREYPWWVWLLFTVPVSFVVIGAGGLIYSLLRWGKSAERRAALAQQAQQGELFGASTAERAYPFVPQGADMTNSPGTRLRFRLPMATSPGWALFGLLMGCVIWNGLVSVFVVLAVREFMAGHPNWLLTCFTIPFVLIGVGLIVYFIRQLLVATGVGPTLVEISDHPIRPGKPYRVFLSQSGRLTIKAMRISLVCEESATYRQGTNTRTESQEVYRRELFCCDAFQIESGIPFETELTLDVPAGAMHSFKAEHNEINWSVAIEGDVAKWPNFKRSFALIVCPAGGGPDR